MSSAQRCLENSLILQKILTSCHLKNIVQLRLVNRTFDAECLFKIRLSHRKMQLDFLFSGRNAAGFFGVNDCYFGIEKHRECFLFLTTTGKVKLEELDIRVDKELTEDMKSTLHTNILNVLLKNHSELKVWTGEMYKFCGLGCSDCRFKTGTCTKYGPATAICLYRDLHEPSQHFDELIVSETLLWAIAVHCVHESETINIECSDTIRSYITPKLSCDHLRVIVNDDPQCFHVRDGTVEKVIPREILEEMCRTYKVKTVEVEMKRVPQKDSSQYWRRAQMFTEFEFFDPNEKCFVSKGFQLEDVQINLLEAQHACRSVFDSHLISNIRSLFPSRNYRILNQNLPDSEMTARLFESILDAVFRDVSRPNNSVTTLRCDTKITDQSIRFEMPSGEFSHNGRVFTCSDCSAITENVEHMAKMFVITDKATGAVLNLEIVVDKKELETIQNGFLKHYFHL